MKHKIWTMMLWMSLIGVVLVSACSPKARATREAERQNPQVVVEKEVTRVEVEKVPQTVEKQVEVERLRATATPAPQATAVPVVAVPVVHGGQTLPNDQPFDSMFFEHQGVNPFIDTEDDHLSTFAMDVDTASYTVARRYIKEGYLPPQDAVRVEEFINYFDLAYPGPTEGQGAFAIHLEGAPSPFGGEGYHLLQIGIQGRRIHAEDRKDAVLVFVIDVSGSMGRENRLGMVQRALRMLVEELRPTDQVGIVAYGSRAYTVLEPIRADRKQRIRRAIDGLRAGGSTYAEEGLLLGYEMAYRAFEEGAINRIILCSDGVANVGRTSAEGILDTVADYAARGIVLSTVGFGMGNYNDVLLESLADQGDGNYAYVDTLDEAERIFVENLEGTLQVIARDAKIQVDFNPQVVSRYRLLGYENRDVADEDFRDNDVDAGEVGAGHSVTALYEVKFHKGVEPGEGAERALTVHVRYQDPDWGDVVEVAREFWADEFRADWMQASPAFLLTAAVAEYAEILRGSFWAKEGGDGVHRMEDVLWLARMAGDELEEDEVIGTDVSEFIWLVERAERLASKG